MRAEDFVEKMGEFFLYELQERMRKEKEEGHEEGYKAGFKKGFEAGNRAGYKKKGEDTAKFDSFVDLAGLDADK